ncbi:hypothetical protein D3C81_2018380 [compost metagenome]
MLSSTSTLLRSWPSRPVLMPGFGAQARVGKRLCSAMPGMCRPDGIRLPALLKACVYLASSQV